MPFAVLAAFFALLFREALFGGRFILVGDPLKQFYPLRTVAWEMIRNGDLPLWTPHILSGYPMSSMVMLGLGYPLTWLYLFLPGHWAEQLYVLAPYFLAPIFTYLFLREWDRSAPAAVLGGLTFGYGGFLFSPIGLTGIHANSALWMPLLLLGVARARRRPLIPSLLIATFAYTMSVLAGSGQIFLYAGALALGYALYLAIVPDRPADSDQPPRRWQPLAVAAGAIALSVGLTAFQMFETWTAVRQSVREAYPVQRLEEGSFPSMLAVRSLLQPLGNYWDSATFVPLIALVLALVALFTAGRRGAHIYFWGFVAVISWLLVLGKHSPIFEWYARVPFVKMFRYPSRHSMEWTFAIGVLAAYGWDFLEKRVADGRSRRSDTAPRGALTLAGAAGAVIAAVLIAVRWGEHIVRAGLDAIADLNNVVTRFNGPYLVWKFAFTLCVGLAVWLLWRLSEGRLRMWLPMAVMAFGCFVEPFLWMVRPVVRPWSVSGALFGSFAESTHVVKRHLRPLQRTYSLPHPYAVSTEPVRDVDAVNWTALAGMEDANGYESLILSRYSRAFRGQVDTEPFVAPDWTLLGLKSQVLDLLGVAYVVAFQNFASVPGFIVEKDGVVFSSSDFAQDIKVERSFSLPASGTEADSLILVTTLGLAGYVEQGTPVMRISLHTVDGRIVERDLIAGIHTAEMTYDRPDVKAVVRHQLAPIFDSGPGDPSGSFQNHRYLAKIGLGERLRVTQVDFLKTTSAAGVGLWKVTLHDSATGKSAPLAQPPLERWQTIYDRGNVVVLKNLRAMPRAWMVTKVGTLDEAELLRVIRGESDLTFDPRTTAFLEAGKRGETAVQAFVQQAATPATPPQVRILSFKPTRMRFETTSTVPAMMVVGEIHYPGWEATVDGAAAPIHRTNFFLRGVFVPAGRHTVEMTYRAPGLRNGAMVSLATLLLIGFGSRSRRLRAL